MNAYEELIEVALIKDLKHIEKKIIKTMFEINNEYLNKRSIESLYKNIYDNKLNLKPYWLFDSEIGAKCEYVSLYIDDIEFFKFSHRYIMKFEYYPEDIWKIEVDKKWIDRSFYNSSTIVSYKEETFFKILKMINFLNNVKSKFIKINNVGYIVNNKKKSNNLFYQEDIVCQYKSDFGKYNNLFISNNDMNSDEVFLNFLEEKFFEFYPERIFDKSFFELDENEIEILTGYYI